METVCAKCHKRADYGLKVKRESKFGVYYYIQYRHKQEDHRKAARYTYCYVRVKPTTETT